MRRLIYVAFFLEVGLLLIVLPWSAFWDRNYFADKGTQSTAGASLVPSSQPVQQQ